MKRKSAALLLALCLLLTGCRDVGVLSSADGPTVVVVSPTQSKPTAAPTPTATPEAEEEADGDADRSDEADYYFDFGQDDLIRLSYDVSWPAEKMEGWERLPDTRVGALLTLQKGASTITVLMEEAPEYATLDAFMDYAAQMFRYTCADGDTQPAEEGEERVLTGVLEDGALIQWRCRTVDGLYVTCELTARGEAAEDELALFTGTFCPEITFTYTEIDSLTGCHGEE